MGIASPQVTLVRHPRLSIVRRRCRLLHLYNQRETRSDLYFLKGQVKAGRYNRPTMLSCTVEAKRGLQSSLKKTSTEECLFGRRDCAL